MTADATVLPHRRYVEHPQRKGTLRIRWQRIAATSRHSRRRDRQWRPFAPRRSRPFERAHPRRRPRSIRARCRASGRFSYLTRGITPQRPRGAAPNRAANCRSCSIPIRRRNLLRIRQQPRPSRRAM
jgi:hypothetical protein